ncbi:MAG: insulinase family protein [Andreesenia angusta]|nr:insulinase family protein [Andreesenia angusta]
MKLEIGKEYHGFKFIKEEFIEEENSNALIFEDEKTKARLLKLSNKDNNKVFGIGFKTPPENSTGVAHILEHSVLNGSKKYTTREPFMDLLKSSLQTFLNAMTFSDKTIYPVASRNEKDFHNLMDVYLDAVFNPRIYEKKEIFMQEGWHYELKEEDQDLKYKGVVYNEMRGAMSAPEDQVMEKIMKSLYPNTIYKNNSGGDPYEIPKLSYEEFLDFHRKFYHPSNSYIFLYGNGDLDRELSHIEEYLKNYEYLDVDSYIKPQESFDEPKVKLAYYSLSKDEFRDKKAYLAYSVCLGKSTSIEDSIMNDLLNEIFIESEASPIKKSLLEQEICEDIISTYTDGLYQTFSIIAKNADAEDKYHFDNIIREHLSFIVKNGIDEKLLNASLNKIEFALRERQDNSAKGVISFITAFHTWLYGESPLKALKYEEPLKKLKEKLKNGYFEEYIEKRVLNNNHKTLLVVHPEPGLFERLDIEADRKLREYKDSLNDEEMKDIIENNQKLDEFQTRIDTEEDKKSIPKLSLKDIDTKIERINLEEKEIDDIKILHLNEYTNGIDYIKMVFNIDFLEYEDIPYLSLLSSLLGNLNTDRFDYATLSNEIYINSGGIDSYLQLYTDSNTDELYPKFVLSAKCIDDKIEETLDIMNEIAFKTILDDKKRIGEIIMQLKSKLEMNIFNSGHIISMARALSKLNPSYKYNELSKGLDYYFFLQEIDQNLDSIYDDLIEKLKDLYSKIFRRNDLLINLTMNTEDYNRVYEILPRFLDNLNNNEFEKADFRIEDKIEREGITSGASVQYISKAADLRDSGFEYDGSMEVLTNIVNMEYLHNNIRAIGGAYGAGMKIYSNGCIATYSYRDPNLKNTIDVYNGIGKYIENMELTEEDLENSIIGSMRAFDPVLTVNIKSELALNRYIKNTRYEDLDRYLKEALETDLEKLKSYSSLLNKAMAKDSYTVLGNETIILDNKDLFDSILRLKK